MQNLTSEEPDAGFEEWFATLTPEEQGSVLAALQEQPTLGAVTAGRPGRVPTKRGGGTRNRRAPRPPTSVPAAYPRPPTSVPASYYQETFTPPTSIPAAYWNTFRPPSSIPASYWATFTPPSAVPPGYIQSLQPPAITNPMAWSPQPSIPMPYLGPWGPLTADAGEW